MRNGSSPNVSLTRPQRRSRAMHSTGEKVQWMPVAAISAAVARATRSTSAGSQVPAMPSWVGKIVAPGQNEWPWMQSSPTSSGIRSRVCGRQLARAEHALRRGVQDRPGVHRAAPGRRGRRGRRAAASARPSPRGSSGRAGRRRVRRRAGRDSGSQDHRSLQFPSCRQGVKRLERTGPIDGRRLVRSRAGPDGGIGEQASPRPSTLNQSRARRQVCACPSTGQRGEDLSVLGSRACWGGLRSFGQQEFAEGAEQGR